MRIRNIRIQKTSSGVKLLADCKVRPVGWDTVYFAVDAKYADFVHADASPFAAGLLIPAMYFKENLEIDGPVSKMLLDGMYRIMDTMAGWYPELSHIAIRANAIIEENAHPRHVGTFFSGGVDSFYTLLKRLEDPVNNKPSYLVSVRGSDIQLQNEDLWRITKHMIEEVAEATQTQPIFVETNLPTLLEPMLSPDLTHGGSLAAVGIFLSGGLRMMYIPSSFGGDQMMPYGSHPDLDIHWSTELVTFVHDGDEVDRFDKIRLRVAQSPLALSHLRVCYMNKKGRYNCGTCDKCIRTMVALYALDKFGECKTFPPSLDFKNIEAKVRISGKMGAIGHQRNLEVLKEMHKHPELQEVLSRALANVTDHSNGFVDRAFKAWVYYDHRYFRGISFALYMRIRPYIKD